MLDNGKASKAYKKSHVKDFGGNDLMHGRFVRCKEFTEKA